MRVSDNEPEEVVFVRPKDRKKERWEGLRPGVEGAKNQLGAHQAFSIHEFSERLKSLMEGFEDVYFDLHDSFLRHEVLQAMQIVDWRQGKKVKRPRSFHHLAPLLGEMRLIKDEKEIFSMKKAAKATRNAHLASMAFADPTKKEGDVANLMGYVLQKYGASGHAYPPIVASGTNGLILHYNHEERNSPLKKGETLLIDVGGECDFYTSDVSRTFPVDGVYTGPQKEIYHLVLMAQKKAIDMAVPGETLGALHKASSMVLIEGLLDLGILKGDSHEIWEKQTHTEYYPHKTSHWLGLDVHDTAPYINHNTLEEIKFSPGMVFTVEPGLYFPAADPKIQAPYKGLAVRIEDDILITKKGHDVLTKEIPKEIRDVEKACSEDWRALIIS